MAALYKMFSCQGAFKWIYGECTVKNVLMSRWFDLVGPNLVRHGYGTPNGFLIPHNASKMLTKWASSRLQSVVLVYVSS